MKLHNRITSLLYLIIMMSPHALHAEKAVTRVPIADLIGEPLQTKVGIKQVKKSYAQLPVCGGAHAPGIACPRIHQLLFNELVEVVDERGPEVKITIPHLYYLDAKGNKQTSYWTLKDNLCYVKQLSADNHYAIPQPINFQAPSAAEHGTIITLIKPWYDPSLKQTFSVGTRFVQSSTQQTDKHYTVLRINPKTQQTETITLDKTVCVLNHERTVQERIALFLDILHQWIHEHTGFIPYVWGGASFTHVYTHHQPHEIINHKAGNKISFFALKSDPLTYKAGFDCTNLVSRAAQIAGIPYYCKNSTTVAQELSALQANETIHNGDLFWIPGHVMVVADVDNNMLIEARHYSHGYGKLQKLPVHKIFKNMNSFADIQDAMKQKKPLERIDAHGAVRETFKEFKLLKMASVWK